MILLVLLLYNLNSLHIPASAADAAVNPNGLKNLLANGLIAFFMSGNSIFSNGPKIYQ